MSFPFQPTIPESEAVLQETDRRAGHAEMGIEMGPGADQRLFRSAEMFHQAKDRVGIAVGPAADRIDRALDGVVILTDRAMAPIVVAALVAEPGNQRHLVAGDTREPHLAPRLADHGAVGRPADDAEDAGTPADRIVEDTTALPMHVVGIAVVGRGDRDDRLELGRSSRGDLQPGETTPGDADHADRAGAPGLIRPATPISRAHRPVRA